MPGVDPPPDADRSSPAQPVDDTSLPGPRPADATTVGGSLRRGAKWLAGVSASARRDAEVLLGHACGWSRAQLMAAERQAMTSSQSARYEGLLRRRAGGEPVAYIVGRREFWSLMLEVTPDTLIPRPETERLVEQALARIPLHAAWRIADLGTGSGAIALAVASERPACRITATDVCPAALAVAKRNAHALGITNVEFACGDWFDVVDSVRLDVILANPPYVPDTDSHLRRGDVRFEPPAALRGGPDGLAAIETIVAAGKAHMRREGWIIVEHGFDQAAAVRAALHRSGYHSVQSYPDLTGHSRITEGRA